MKQRTGLVFGLTVVLMAYAGVALANNPPPPVNQHLGIKDGVFNNLIEGDCRLCHENPSVVDSALIPDRHHNLVGKKIQNNTAAPHGAAGQPFECLSCHNLVKDPEAMSFVFTPFRDCRGCHEQKAGGTVHHVTATAQNKNCKRCHGSFVDNPGDGHYIPTYNPSLVTPWPSGKANSGPNGEGNCNFCHSTNTAGVPGPIAEASGVKVYLNKETHHSTGLISSTTSCLLCHDLNSPAEMKIRRCEACHGVSSLHNIQFDDGTNGGVVPGQEKEYLGHIGSQKDCIGCHGFTSRAGVAAAPYMGPIVAQIDKLSARELVAGRPSQLTVFGSGFVNSVFDPATGEPSFEIRSSVLLSGDDGTSVRLTPALVSSDLLVVDLPVDLPAGNYLLTAVKGDKGSNPVAIAVKRPVVISSLSCTQTQVTVAGSGFSDYVNASNVDLGLTVQAGLPEGAAGQDRCTILEWTDTSILAECPHEGTLTVHGVFGTASMTMLCRQ